jgi:hypothetical protein
MNNKTVPSNIYFDSTLLLTPSLEELGIPAPLSYIAYIEHHAEYGDWIDRGDLLVTFHLAYYQHLEKPAFWAVWKPDVIHVQSFALSSPVSGLVVDVRFTPCRHQGSLAVSVMDNASHSIIENAQHLPTILLPRDEPAWNAYDLERLYGGVHSSIAGSWQLNEHNCGAPGGYKSTRLGAISDSIFWQGSMSEYAEQKLSDAVSLLAANSASARHTTWPVCEYAKYKPRHGDNLNRLIESYRAKDQQLRDKLVHLIHSSK